mmetsp:Transcript_24078/g.42513  ORF Transcript_24078/g.42513 Transcript_24078/m.42513 type:complete len:442 (-) Transcript_24078:57-1382(-)
MISKSAASRALSTAASTSSAASKKVAFIDGARIPFTPAATQYKDYISYDLGRMAVKGLVDKLALDGSIVDGLLWGTVIQEVRTNNIAREVTLGAGLPQGIPSHTIGQACISSSQAVCTGAERILAGRADVMIAGGSETFSDVPIRFSKPIRQRLLGANKALKKGPAGALKLLKGLKLKDMAPEPPAIKNFTTGEIMGHSSDRLASRFGVSREEQDDFAVASHHNAARAHEQGHYKREIIPVHGFAEDSCVRGDTTLEKMANLKPAFVKPHGTHTPGNSSPLTDGASACLVMSDTRAKELGFTPRSYLKSWNFVAVDPFEEMLLGPAYGIAKVLKENNLTLKDIDVFEIHEAFAGQVLANLAALDSEKWCREMLDMDRIGRVPSEKLNQWGGSISIGHPFGATGVRLTTTATNRLHVEDGKLALIAACADGGQAHASLLERA